MIDDPLIQKKQEQRRAFLRILYGYVDGKEGHSISPQLWLTLGERAGIPKQEVPEVMRFLLSGDLVANKPASEAVALTHKGVVSVEEDSARMTDERKQRLNALPDKILGVLETEVDTLQLFQLKAALPDLKDLQDAEWFEALKN